MRNECQDGVDFGKDYHECTKIAQREHLVELKPAWVQMSKKQRKQKSRVGLVWSMQSTPGSNDRDDRDLKSTLLASPNKPTFFVHSSRIPLQALILKYATSPIIYLAPHALHLKSNNKYAFISRSTMKILISPVTVPQPLLRSILPGASRYNCILSLIYQHFCFPSLNSL